MLRSPSEPRFHELRLGESQLLRIKAPETLLVDLASRSLGQLLAQHENVLWQRHFELCQCLARLSRQVFRRHITAHRYRSTDHFPKPFVGEPKDGAFFHTGVIVDRS